MSDNTREEMSSSSDGEPQGLLASSSTESNSSIDIAKMAEKLATLQKVMKIDNLFEEFQHFIEQRSGQANLGRENFQQIKQDVGLKSDSSKLLDNMLIPNTILKVQDTPQIICPSKELAEEHKTVEMTAASFEPTLIKKGERASENHPSMKSTASHGIVAEEGEPVTHKQSVLSQSLIFKQEDGTNFSLETERISNTLPLIDNAVLEEAENDCLSLGKSGPDFSEQSEDNSSTDLCDAHHITAECILPHKTEREKHKGNAQHFQSDVQVFHDTSTIMEKDKLEVKQHLLKPTEPEEVDVNPHHENEVVLATKEEPLYTISSTERTCIDAPSISPNLNVQTVSSSGVLPNPQKVVLRSHQPTAAQSNLNENRKRDHDGNIVSPVIPKEQSSTLSKTEVDISENISPASEALCRNELEETQDKQLLTSLDEEMKFTTDYSIHSVQCQEFDISSAPVQVAVAQQEFQSNEGGNFLKGCKWSPDGTCILTNSDDGKLRLFNLPAELYSSTTPQPQSDELRSILTMSEGELVYDFCWYPFMTSSRPETCCFVSVCRDHPIHMWDAFDGALRCTYKPHNHLDELVTPHSVVFSLDGSKLYCGFNKVIKVFDVARPGRDCKTMKTKDKNGGQSGIISCFAMCPDGSSYAAGSYSKTIGIYSDSFSSPIFVLHGQRGGVTHLIYSNDGHYLYSGGRKDDEIICWDVRKINQELCRFHRVVDTNQRIYFDIDRSNKYLASGNTNGSLYFWNLAEGLTSHPSYDSCPIVEPNQSYPMHTDAVNGVSFHPSFNLIATTSGQRKFHLHLRQGAQDSDYGSEDESSGQDEEDNSLRIWSLDPRRNKTR